MLTECAASVRNHIPEGLIMLFFISDGLCRFFLFNTSNHCPLIHAASFYCGFFLEGHDHPMLVRSCCFTYGKQRNLLPGPSNPLYPILSVPVFLCTFGVEILRDANIFMWSHGWKCSGTVVQEKLGAEDLNSLQGCVFIGSVSQGESHIFVFLTILSLFFTDCGFITHC